VQQALDRGGHDNVTVIVAAYRIPDEPARTNPEKSGQIGTRAAKSV
jgi:hypothetical protein